MPPEYPSVFLISEDARKERVLTGHALSDGVKERIGSSLGQQWQKISNGCPRPARGVLVRPPQQIAHQVGRPRRSSVAANVDSFAMNTKKGKGFSQATAKIVRVGEYLPVQ